MIAAVVALATLAVALAAALVARSGLRLRRPAPGRERILVPFTGGTLEPAVLDAAIRIARAEDATLVPAYLLLVPLRYSESSPLSDEVAVAMPWLEAVEHAAHRAGVPVDARIEKGRSPTHALKRLWEVEHFDRIVAPAPADTRGGFSPKDLAWILTHAPAETLVLRPGPAQDERRPLPTAESGRPPVEQRHRLVTRKQQGLAEPVRGAADVDQPPAADRPRGYTPYGTGAR